MGLLKAGIGAAAGALSDQWRDYFYCDSLTADVLMTKGQRRGTNNKGDENIITNGSIIAVNEGQCMIVVQQGEIIEVCAEAGEFVFDSGTEPSVLYGGLGQGIKGTFERIGRRFTFAGNTANDQRVYFFNTKEIMGNKFGTPTPVPFRVVDANIGLDTDISVRCNGEYSYKIVDPLLFYKNVAANVSGSFTRDKIDGQLKSEFLTALQPGFARISEMGVRYSAVPGHTMELAQALNETLSASWNNMRGIAIAAVGINSIAANPEDEERIKQLQMTAVMRDPNMRAANASMATGEAMKTAAGNEAGAMMGFMGMNMANMTGMGMGGAPMGFGGQQGYGQQQQYTPQNAYQTQAAWGQQQGGGAGGWTCPKCGSTNSGKFCMECGTPKPEPKPAGGWTCPKCGSSNTGKFCMECGTPKPAGDGSWTCECGTVNKGKFCANCGHPRP
ncbi:MAG: SPFH domain-containing protein [Coriobacteriales bacterium]|nr:SPFH domain-containing protein [Coriobacteriales bacterium]